MMHFFAIALLSRRIVGFCWHGLPQCSLFAHKPGRCLPPVVENRVVAVVHLNALEHAQRQARLGVLDELGRRRGGEGQQGEKSGGDAATSELVFARWLGLHGKLLSGLILRSKVFRGGQWVAGMPNSPAFPCGFERVDTQEISVVIGNDVCAACDKLGARLKKRACLSNAALDSLAITLGVKSERTIRFGFGDAPCNAVALSSNLDATVDAGALVNTASACDDEVLTYLGGAGVKCL